MHARHLHFLLIMTLTFSSFLESSQQFFSSPHPSNITQSHRLKPHSHRKSLKHHPPPPTPPSSSRKVASSSHKSHQLHADNTAPYYSAEVSDLLKRSFMNLIGSDGVLVSRRSEAHVPTYVMDLYRQALTRKLWRSTHRRLQHGWFHGDTIRSFMPDLQEKLSARHSSDRKLRGGKYLFRFNTTHLPRDEQSKGSELRIFYTPPPPSHKHLHSHRTHKRTQALERMYVFLFDPSTHRHILLDRKTFPKWRPQWISLNVSRVFGNLSDRSDLTFKVLLSSRHKHRHKRSSDHPQGASLAIDDPSHTPLLVTYSDVSNPQHQQQQTQQQQTTTQSHKRKKRTKNFTSPAHRQSVKRRQHNLCRRRRFYVGFEMLGWDDWIVAPNGYEAFFCQGFCPTFMPDYLNATNHATIQSLMHSRNPKQVPRPCCVPTRLEPLTLLYLAQRKGYIIKEYPNMVVLGCGCR